MKPEDAKPRDFDGLFEHGWKFQTGRIDNAQWFTAKETAEIAGAYAEAYFSEEVSLSDSKDANAWREKFEEWSK